MPALRFCSREGSSGPAKATDPSRIQCLNDEPVAAPDALRLAKNFLRFREKRKNTNDEANTAISHVKSFVIGLGDALKHKVEKTHVGGCFRKVEMEVKVALDPRFLRDHESLMAAIHLRIDPWIGQHKPELDGTVLMYTRIRLAGQRAAINGEFPFLQCLMTFDALVFRTEPGKLLIGEVNHMSGAHVSLKVFGLIPAKIEDKESNFEFEAEDETGNSVLWRRKGTDEVIKKGSIVVFEAQGIAGSRGIITVDGSLASKKTRIIVPTTEFKKRKAERFAEEVVKDKEEGTTVAVDKAAEKLAEEKAARKRARKARKEAEAAAA